MIDEVGAEQRTGEANAAVNADGAGGLTLEGAYVVDGRGGHFDGLRPVVLERTRREDVLGRRVDSATPSSDTNWYPAPVDGGRTLTSKRMRCVSNQPKCPDLGTTRHCYRGADERTVR